MITNEEIKMYDEEVLRHQEEADSARDEVREIIEQLDTNKIIFINTFMKRIYGLNDFKPYGGDLCASYRNSIREQLAYCEDVELLDLVWRILFKSQPQDEDVAEHHKWEIEKSH